MKKIVSIILGIMIFAIPCFVFASSNPEPIILPVGDLQSPNFAFTIEMSNGSENSYWAETSPVYLIFYHPEGDSNYYYLYFSDSNTHGYRKGAASSYAVDISNQYNGFYYVSGVSYSPVSFPVYEVDSDYTVFDVINDVNDTVFSTTFDLMYLVNGATSWLSAVVNGVLQAPMLLFLILVPFIGIAVGLLFRFRRG